MTTPRYTEAAQHFEKALRTLLPDEDWDNQHLQKTPVRYMKALSELTQPMEFEFTTFKNDDQVDEMVICGPVQFTSLCAHHLLPFSGSAWVAYIPSARLAGLSKLARTIISHSRGLWVQEDLNQFIANFLNAKLSPVGVGVVMKAEHTCMTIRGVKSPGSYTTTSAMLGAFRNPDEDARQEFLDLIAKEL